jgi:hypothetical protein
MMFQNVSIPQTHCLNGSVECLGFMKKSQIWGLSTKELLKWSNSIEKYYVFW